MLQGYFEISLDCMFHLRVEPEGRFVYDAINPVALASTGLTLDAMLGRTPEEMLGPEKGGMMTEGLRQVCATGTPYHYTPTWELPTGSVTFDAIYIPQVDDAGTVTGILGMARDITKERFLEASLLQLQRMEAMGKLASGVAHDFNNLLAGFHACLTLLNREVNSDAGRRLLAEGLRTVERGKALTDGMLKFSRHHSKRAARLNLNALTDGMGAMMSWTLGPRVGIKTFLAADLWSVIANHDEAELALLNLAANARDAMPLGGKLTIETRNEVVSAAPSEDFPGGNYVVMAVSDTGEGMPSDVLANALQPFFTTKEDGKGTGLGLSTIKGMMTLIGGKVTISSEVGRGTCVSLYFPRALD